MFKNIRRKKKVNFSLKVPGHMHHKVKYQHYSETVQSLIRILTPFLYSLRKLSAISPLPFTAYLKHVAICSQLPSLTLN